MRERQVEGMQYPSDGDMTLYDYAVMLRADLDNAKKTIVRLRNENKEVRELKQQLVECREALDASMEREHAAELREHEHRRRYEQNLHKLNLVKEKIQSEKEGIQAARPTPSRARVREHDNWVWWSLR